MEYTVSKLAKLAKISDRTLRYYDDLGLLSPSRQLGNGYRVYGDADVNRLQHILFYRELGIALSEIKMMLSSGQFDAQEALEGHLKALCEKRQQLDLLISNVEKTIKAQKGETVMSDQEKFSGFMNHIVDENERQYGEEARRNYGDSAINRTNEKLRKISKAEYDSLETLTNQLNATLKAAFLQGDPAGELAQEACGLHQKWLGFYWEKYSKQAHRGLAQMYTEDPRFYAYYDRIAPGCALFLQDAIFIYTDLKQ